MVVVRFANVWRRTNYGYHWLQPAQPGVVTTVLTAVVVDFIHFDLGKVRSGALNVLIRIRVKAAEIAAKLGVELAVVHNGYNAQIVFV